MMEGRLVYVMVLIILAQSIYPITESNSIVVLTIWQVMFGAMMVSATVVVAHDRPRELFILRVLGAIWLLGAVNYSFNQNATYANLIAYLMSSLFALVVIKLLLKYIFRVTVVNRDVLYAAVAVYFLIGAVFVTIYGALETVTYEWTNDHAFGGGSIVEAERIPWQDFYYFSFVTLTTAGYGDIVPISMWARSIAGLQAVTGTLYLAIIIARLVGLYAQERE